MDGGRNGGLLEDQMDRQDEIVGQNTEVTEPEVFHEDFNITRINRIIGLILITYLFIL